MKVTASHADMIGLFGKENVQEATIAGSEGEVYAGTKLFPKNPERTVEVLWTDEKSKKGLKAFMIRQDRSVWKTAQGIGIGTSLKELEKLNGGPFGLSGFDWDLGGRVLSWSSGSLGKALPKTFSLHLGYSNPAPLNEREFQAVTGDQALKSDSPILQKLNPRVEVMSCYFE